jgi:hypothetical protein
VPPRGREERGQTRAPLALLQLRRCRAQAERWLACFEPLLNYGSARRAADCRRRLRQIPVLRVDGQDLLYRLQVQATPAEATLVATLRDALRELDGLERDYRQRLGLLAPGDPAAEVDLEPLRARLAEAAARHEVGALVAGTGTPPRLKLAVPHGTWCSQEQLELEGRELRLRRRTWLGPWLREYQLAPGSRARVAGAALGIEGDVTNEVVLEDAEGNEIRFAAGRPYREQKRLAARLNEYLDALRD